MSSLLTKPIVQHHLSRVSPIQLRDFPLTVFRLGRTAPPFRPNEGARGGKAWYMRDLSSLRRVYPPIWRAAAGVGVRWPIRWLHWGLAVLVSGFTLLWPKNHRVYPLLTVALIFISKYFMAVKNCINIFVLCQLKIRLR